MQNWMQLPGHKKRNVEDMRDKGQQRPPSSKGGQSRGKSTSTELANRSDIDRSDRAFRKAQVKWASNIDTRVRWLEGIVEEALSCPADFPEIIAMLNSGVE